VHEDRNVENAARDPFARCAAIFVDPSGNLGQRLAIAELSRIITLRPAADRLFACYDFDSWLCFLLLDTGTEFTS
jgi:hypothetical protein